MKIEEIIHSCTSEHVAAAAVSSMGRAFLTDVSAMAHRYGMSVGAFTVFGVARFARLGDEFEMRAVQKVMHGAQEPVLAGLHRILCMTLASGLPASDRCVRSRTVQMMPNVGVMDADARRAWID